LRSTQKQLIASNFRISGAEVSVIRYTDTSLVCYTINDSFNVKCYRPKRSDLLLLMELSLTNDINLKILEGQWPAVSQKVLLEADIAIALRACGKIGLDIA
jgi:hypothetical protein